MITCFCIVSTCLLISSCKNYHRNKAYSSIPESNIREGEKLAQIHCQSCHELPDPSQLDVNSWEEGVLPQMGPRLGIFKHNFKYYPSFKKDPNLDSTYYPSRPLLDAHEWQAIMDYYLATSPDTLPSQSRPGIVNRKLPGFSVELPSFRLDTPALSFIKINTGNNAPKLLFNDIIKERLFSFSNINSAPGSMGSSGNIVDMAFHDRKYVFCDIGQLNPTNAKLGSLAFGLGDTLRNDSSHLIPVASGLARPVALAMADLNTDGRTDYVVCEFGNLTGALSWFEDRGRGNYLRHILSPLPGAIKAYIVDHNKDGLPDIWALFSQGSECIIVYTNLGNGRFHQEKVLSFPSVYGSSYFELADFNSDGYPDIVYTCGDNADFSMVLKPYHGVYIFTNDGKNKFTNQFFFPIHGCFKAIARDFDNDGDQDLATIAFFADFTNQPEEGFVYLENKGQYRFEPYTFPESELGRWLTMDAGDIDGDGKIDLVLGNFSIRPSETKPKKDWKKGPAFILLKNIN
ncbi:FG-GAP repeat domain-containing protein [Flavitalea sp.]|nr:VCBS repeat-containing protein [Flavitalea sp.]